MRAKCFVLSFLASVVGFSVPAFAQDRAPATGWFVQARMPVTTLSSIFSSTVGTPQFLVGRRGERSGFGVGAGVNRFTFTIESGASENKSTAMLFQVAPAVWFDFFTSPQGSTVGNVLMSVGYGRVSTKQEITGSPDTDASGNLIDFVLGVGGDHFLEPHFSLGVEVGVHGAYAFGIEPDTGGDKTGFSAGLFYAGIRSTIVF